MKAKDRLFTLITTQMAVVGDIRLLKTVDVDANEFHAEFVVKKELGLKHRKTFRFTFFDGKDNFVFGTKDEVICSMNRELGAPDAGSTDEELIDFLTGRITEWA